MTERQKKALNKKIEQVLDTIYDPEISVSIWRMGLIYRVVIKRQGDVNILMTLTSPACPVAGILSRDVERQVSAIDGVAKVKVKITFDPPWSIEKMSDVAKFELGIL